MASFYDQLIKPFVNKVSTLPQQITAIPQLFQNSKVLPSTTPKPKPKIGFLDFYQGGVKPSSAQLTPKSQQVVQQKAIKVLDSKPVQTAIQIKNRLADTAQKAIKSPPGQYIKTQLKDFYKEVTADQFAPGFNMGERIGDTEIGKGLGRTLNTYSNALPVGGLVGGSIKLFGSGGKIGKLFNSSKAFSNALNKEGLVTEAGRLVKLRNLKLPAYAKLIDDEEVKSFQKAVNEGVKFDPFVVDETGNLLDGAKRLQAFIKLGIDEVPTVVQKAGKEIPQVLDDLTKERQFISSVREAPKTASDVAKKITGTYTPLANEELATNAIKLVNENPQQALEIAKAPGNASAETFAISQALIDKYQNSGQFQEAIELVEETARKATEQGQAIQALSLYSRLTPTGILKFTQRLIDSANAKSAGKKLKLTEEAAKDLVDQATKIADMPDGRAKEIATAKLLDTATSQVPTSILAKVSSLQTMAHLLNPKTAIRNIIGNAGFAGMENLSDAVAVPIDKAVSFVTKQRTKVAPDLLSQFRGGYKGLKLGLEDALRGVDTSAAKTQYDLPTRVIFKNPILKGAEKLLNIELKAPDRAFYQAAYEGSISNLLRANKTEIVTDAMREIAHHDALYRTFQDNNVVSKVFSGLKKALNANKEFGLGDVLIKYPKTPGAILARGIDYSPAGFVKTVFELAKPLFGQKFNQKVFVESTSRAITGTSSLIGTGAILHRLGIITGRREEDKDINAVQRATGLGQYQINTSALKRFIASGLNPNEAKLRPGDKLATYDWFQPQAIGLSIGANIDDHKGGVTSLAGAIAESVGQGTQTLAEQPLVRGFSQFFQGYDLNQSIGRTLQGVPASFVPTLLNQVRQLFDNTRRNTNEKDPFMETFNLVRNKIPGASHDLPPMVDVIGKDQEVYQDKSNSLFNVFLNPSFSSKYNPTPGTSEVLEIFSKSGETQQAHKLISESQTINGESIKITSKQQAEMQRFVGTKTEAIFNSLSKDTEFNSLSDEEKAKEMAGYITDINTAGKFLLLGHRPEKMSTQAKTIVAQTIANDLDKATEDQLKEKLKEYGQRGVLTDDIVNLILDISGF